MFHFNFRLALLVVLCLVSITSLSVAQSSTDSEPAVRITLLPYLQNPASDGMTVCFAAKTAEVTDVEVVLVSKSPSSVSATRATAVPGTPWSIWKARLKGLQQGASYKYKVTYAVTMDGKKEKTETPTYSFQTFNPAAPNLCALCIADLHSNTARLTKLAEYIKPDSYDVSFLIGDNWNDPSGKDGASRVFQCLGDYIRLLDGSQKPILYLAGNHEHRGSFSSRMAYLFDLPHLDATKATGEQQHQFTLRAGPVWFLSMDCGEDFNKKMAVFEPYRKLQLEWLKKKLATKANLTADWRVMLSHIPLYNQNIWSSEPSRKMWEPTLNTAQLDLAMAGHDHGMQFLPAGKTNTITYNPKYHTTIPQKKTYSTTPPYPVFIVPQRGFTLLDATKKKLTIKTFAEKDGNLIFERTFEKAK